MAIIYPLFVLPNIKAMKTQVSKVTGFSPFEMVYHTEPPDMIYLWYIGSKEVPHK